MEPRLRKSLPALVPAAMYRLALIFSFCVALVHAQGIITSIAGGGQFQVTGVPTINVHLSGIGGVATNSQGNVSLQGLSLSA